MIERKIKYDGTTVNTNCTITAVSNSRIDVIHYIEQPFTMSDTAYNIKITTAHYTRATYWLDRPYNMYRWFTNNEQFVAAYFNIVGQTTFDGQLLTFQDLIIDVLLLPSGDYFILDEQELPEILTTFENGHVADALRQTLEWINAHPIHYFAQLDI